MEVTWLWHQLCNFLQPTAKTAVTSSISQIRSDTSHTKPYNLATVVLHQCGSDVELVGRSRVFSSHLEHGARRLDALRSPRKPHVLYVRLSTWNAAVPQSTGKTNLLNSHSPLGVLDLCCACSLCTQTASDLIVSFFFYRLCSRNKRGV